MHIPFTKPSPGQLPEVDADLTAFARMLSIRYRLDDLPAAQRHEYSQLEQRLHEHLSSARGPIGPFSRRERSAQRALAAEGVRLHLDLVQFVLRNLDAFAATKTGAAA